MITWTTQRQLQNNSTLNAPWKALKSLKWEHDKHHEHEKPNQVGQNLNTLWAGYNLNYQGWAVMTKTGPRYIFFFLSCFIDSQRWQKQAQLRCFFFHVFFYLLTNGFYLFKTSRTTLVQLELLDTAVTTLPHTEVAFSHVTTMYCRLW